ncbi:predicted protein [Nematostella vectensis]|uniref:Uncharacterized protein n=1 Tax=Nematostella vectensis TaxID=45351 RepID=A7S0I5_NEMVE|nr:predicted protein [Nematostella vectensis]|eukprot:XP_001634800.1 predicted protein [Nematostella vectensis]
MDLLTLKTCNRAQSLPQLEIDTTTHTTKSSQKERPGGNESSSHLKIPDIQLEGETLDIDPDIPEIHLAVLEGNLQRLIELVESGTSVNTPDLEGWPPLHTAIKHQHYDCAQYLIKHGANDYFERQQEEYRKRLHLSSRIVKGRLYSF